MVRKPALAGKNVIILLWGSFRNTGLVKKECFTMLDIDQSVAQSFLFQFFFQVFGWKMDGFIAQTKCSPVNDHHFFGIEFFKRLNRFTGIDMAGSHEPSGFIGAKIDDHQVDVEILSDL